MKYTAFGEIREMNGSSPTDYLYTGQRKEVEFGLSFYNSRWVDCSTGHFISADTLIPESKRCFDLGRICDANSPIAARCVGDSGAWDRYAYVLNPMRYTDSTGHWIDPDNPDMPGTPEAKSHHNYPDIGKSISEHLGRKRIQRVAQKMYSQKRNYYLWGVEDQTPGVNISEPPYPIQHSESTVAFFTNFDTGTIAGINIWEQTGNRIPTVCTDIPYLAYMNSGLLLNPKAYSYSAFDTGYDRAQGSVWSETATMRGVSSIGGYFNLSQYIGQEVEEGDIIKFGDIHVGLVVDVGDSYSPDEIYILHTSERMVGLNIDNLSFLISAFSELNIEVGVYKEWDD